MITRDRGAWSVVLLLCFVATVRAEPVFVKQGPRVGAGFTFTDGSSCYLVTAEHTVVEEEPVTVVDQQRKRATVNVTRRGPLLGSASEGQVNRFDVAVAKFASDSQVACTTRWDNGAASSRFFASPSNLEAPLRATRVLENGSTLQQRLQVRRTAEHYLELVPYGRADEFKPGDSGTFLTVSDGGQTFFAGMIIEVEGEIIRALLQSWLDSLIGAALVPQVTQSVPKTVEIAIAAITERNRPIERSAGLMYEALRAVPDVIPTLGTSGDVVVAGSLLSSRPSLQRNDCYTKPGQINLVCAAMGKPTTRYIATVPVQIDYRINNRLTGRVIPFLFSATYSVGAENNQGAEDAAMDRALRDGALQALAAADVLTAVPSTSKSKKNTPPTYTLSNEIRSAVATVSQQANSAPATAGFTGSWSGSYQCGHRTIPLTMELNVDGANNAQGVFKFCNGGNRGLSLPDGNWQFGLAGQQLDDKTLQLNALSPNQDAKRRMPPGYVSVGVVLNLTSPSTIDGSIVNNMCTNVELRKHRGSETGVCD